MMAGKTNLPDPSNWEKKKGQRGHPHRYFNSRGHLRCLISWHKSVGHRGNPRRDSSYRDANNVESGSTHDHRGGR